MRYLSYFLCILFINTACSSPQGDDNEATHPENLKNEKVSLSSDTEILQKLEGKYVELSVEEGGLYFQEPCQFDLPFMEIAMEVDADSWSIYWQEEFYTITAVQKQDDKIILKTNSAQHAQFTISPNANTLLLNFESQHKRSPAIVRIEDLHHFEIWPCSDVKEIIKDFSLSWYELSEIDGEKVIYTACESAPGGFDIAANGESIDMRNGSDPDRIVSMNKIDQHITILYRSQYDESETPRSLVVNLTDQKDFIFINDTRYVSEQAKGEFPQVEEECD